GVYRALDSGPLEAWYVDMLHESEPGADVHPAMAAQGILTGLGLGGGALISGGLVAWHPFSGSSALLLPLQVFVALSVVHLVMTLLLVKERPRAEGRAAQRAWRSARQTPATIAHTARYVVGNRILRGLVLVELFWVTAMMAYETFMPLRLAELVGSEARAGVWMGPAAAAAWAIFSAGSWLAGRLTDRFGAVNIAILGRVLNALGVVLMGLAFGPAVLVLAYLFTYSTHGLAGVPHLSLIHREASSENRVTVLSVNSLMMQVGGAVAGPLLGILAARTSIATAIV